MGSTGDPPVLSGHWPYGRSRVPFGKCLTLWKKSALSVPVGGSPTGTGSLPVLPIAGPQH